MAGGTINEVRRIVRCGAGLGIRLSRETVRQLKLTAGQTLIVRLNSDTITISRPKSREKWTEKKLLKNVNPEMCSPDLISDRRGNELI